MSQLSLVSAPVLTRERPLRDASLDVLDTLRRAPGPLSTPEVVADTGRCRVAVWRALCGLERRGLVLRCGWQDSGGRAPAAILWCST